MRSYSYKTIDVFTETRFGGNPLAVFPDATGLSSAEMQALAAEMNYSETSFVLPPQDPANTASVRIFNRTAEMPFAGHPNVGTGFVLARLGRAGTEVMRFEEISGLVDVRVLRDRTGHPTGAAINAPQALQTLGQLPVPALARCVGLSSDDIVTDRHPPTRATVGVEFVLMEVNRAALSRATPDLAAFRETAAQFLPGTDRLSILLYARDGDHLNARMFAPLAGTWEDPATGSANAALAALLLSLGSDDEIDVTVLQGVDMGRPSRLQLKAWRAKDGIRASVAGNCIAMFQGEVQL